MDVWRRRKSLISNARFDRICVSHQPWRGRRWQTESQTFRESADHGGAQGYVVLDRLEHALLVPDAAGAGFPVQVGLRHGLIKCLKVVAAELGHGRRFDLRSLEAPRAHLGQDVPGSQGPRPHSPVPSHMSKISLSCSGTEQPPVAYGLHLWNGCFLALRNSGSANRYWHRGKAL